MEIVYCRRMEKDVCVTPFKKEEGMDFIWDEITAKKF